MSRLKYIRNVSLGLFFALFVVVIVLAYRAGYTPRYIAAAPAMLVGFSAKMSCSLHYVSQQPKAQVHKDITSYSSLFGLPAVVYNDSLQRVTASFLGRQQQAQYRDSVGCTLVNEGEVLPAVAKPLYSHDTTVQGSVVPTFDKALRSVLAADNAAEQDTRALLVMSSQGAVLGQAYAEGYDASTLFLGWSMAKTFTATLLGSLQYRNVIPPFAPPRLDSNISNLEAAGNAGSPALFAEWQEDARRKITLSDLLTMTSGLDFSEVYEPGSDATKMLFEDASSSSRPLASHVSYSPGEHWLYSSGSANLLSLYAHRALGNTLESSRRYIQEYLLHPLAMNNAVLELDRDGVFVGSSFMFATAKEWASLGVLYLNTGAFGDYQVVSPEWIDNALTPNGSANDSRYGFQLWLNQGRGEQPLRWPSLPAKAFAAQGNRGQFIMVIPERELVVVRLGWGKPKYPVDTRIAHILTLLADVR